MNEAQDYSGNDLPGSHFSVAGRVEEMLSTLGKDKSVQVTGKSWKTLSRYATEGTEPPFSVVYALAVAAGRPISWVVGKEMSEAGGLPSVAGFNAGDDIYDFTLVPRLGVSASAGHGLTALAEEITDRLAFKTDWLRDMGLSPDFCGLLTCSGDSQDPVIKDGALMLVDMRPDQPIRSGCFYIIVLEGDVLVKLINRRIDGSIELISHNPIYPKEIIDAHRLDKLHIPGRVVWAGQRL